MKTLTEPRQEREDVVSNSSTQKEQQLKFPIEPASMGALNDGFRGTLFDRLNVRSIYFDTSAAVNPTVEGQILYHKTDPTYKAMLGGVVVDIPGVGGAKTATIVVGPSSNSDSDSYDYVTDGVADNVEIQAAVDALPTTGGSIALREGTYTFATGSPVTIAKNGVTIFGMGAGTIFAVVGGGSTRYFLLGHASTQYRDCIIRDIYFTDNGASTGMIDNNSSTLTVGNFLVTGCIFKDASDYCIINKSIAGVGGIWVLNNTFINWTGAVVDYAIELDDNTSAKTLNLIHGNYFSNNDTNALVVNANVDYSIFSNNQVSLPDSYDEVAIDGFDIVSGNNITIGASAGANTVIINQAEVVSHNVIRFGATANVASIGIQGCEKVTGNNVSGAGQCFNTSNSTAGLVVGNSFDGKGHIVVIDTGETMIANNSIHVSSAADNTYSGIQINDSNCIIQGNRITYTGGNNLKYGIEEVGAVDNNIIIGNQVSDGQTAKIFATGASTDVSHNITTQ